MMGWWVNVAYLLHQIVFFSAQSSYKTLRISASYTSSIVQQPVRMYFLPVILRNTRKWFGQTEQMHRSLIHVALPVQTTKCTCAWRVIVTAATWLHLLSPHRTLHHKFLSFSSTAMVRKHLGTKYSTVASSCFMFMWPLSAAWGIETQVFPYWAPSLLMRAEKASPRCCIG